MIKNKTQREYYSRIKDKPEFKDKMKKKGKIYYNKNKAKAIAYSLQYTKKNNYKYEKTPEQRAIRYIKRKTRMYFPLEGHNCEFCGKKSTQHHHNTHPIEFDKFNFVCMKCHKDIHNKSRMEVK